MTSRGGRAPALPTDVHWLDLELAALYRHDERGRLTRTREPHGRPAPALAFSRSVHGNLWRFAAGLPSALVRDLSRLCARERPLASGGWADSPEGPAPAERWEAMRRALAGAGFEPDPEWRGPCFRFPAELAVAPEETREWTGIDADRLDAAGESAFAWLAGELEGRRPVVARLEGGVPVSVVWAARGGGEGPGPAIEAGVETLPSHRGRGHARAGVAAWARRVRDLGAEPLYSTSWANRASRGVARSLGLVAFGEHAHLAPLG
ncbi:MAG: GNAT family N-acetyltransferase [Myxococcota bacterium]